MASAEDVDPPFPMPQRLTGASQESSSPDRWGTVSQLSGWIAITGLAVVTATGVWLYFYYQPTASAFADVTTLTDSDVRWTPDVQRAHRIGAVMSATALLAWVVAAAVRHRLMRVAYGLGTLASLVVAFYSGLLLPWDQLALFAVTVGSDISGFSPAFDQEDVTFILIDGRKVAPETLRRWFVAHLFFGGLAFVAVLAPIVNQSRKRLLNGSDPR